jgi:hypothetical protein
VPERFDIKNGVFKMVVAIDAVLVLDKVAVLNVSPPFAISDRGMFQVVCASCQGLIKLNGFAPRRPPFRHNHYAGL